MNAKKESFHRSWRETCAGPLPVCPSGETTNCGPPGSVLGSGSHAAPAALSKGSPDSTQSAIPPR
jgi:hypothetical protein